MRHTRLLTATIALAAVSLGLPACGSDTSTSTDASAPLDSPVAPTTTDAPTTSTTTQNSSPAPTTATPLAVDPSTSAPTTVETTTTAPPPAVTCYDVTFPSGDVDVSGARCDPADGGHDEPLPAAIVLMGCADLRVGLQLDSDLSEALASAGVVALVIGYHSAAPPPETDTYCQPSPETAEAIPALLGAVSDGVAWLRADPGIDANAIGAVGYSLGGLLATFAQVGDVGVASVPPAAFGAIGLISAPMFPPTIDVARAGGMPPLYVVHGDVDDIVDVEDSVSLVDAANESGTEATLVVVPGMYHGWSEPDTATERNTAVADVVDFLSTHLRSHG